MPAQNTAQELYKGKEMTKAETGTETKNRDRENSISSSTEKRRGMSPEIA
jgi:hypothetical protein